MTNWQPQQYEPRRNGAQPSPAAPPQPRQLPPYMPPYGAQTWREAVPPPLHPATARQLRRKSWIRRHKILTGLIALAVVLTGGGILASGHGTPAVASLAACTSHRALSSRQWLQVVKDPAAATGQCITVYGEVAQFDSVTGDGTFRAQAGGVKASTQFGIADYPTNALFDGDANMLSVLVEGDLFTAQVTVAGSQSYTTTLGGETTVPVFRVDSVARTGHLGS